MDKYLWVGFGGFLGSIARFGLASLVQERTQSLFPWGTMTVNVIGCFLIGLLMTLFQERFTYAPHLRLFLVIGILGGFTTFSSFSYDTFALLKSGQVSHALLNAGLSVALCLVGTWAGFWAGENL